jgi:lysosomal acid lipase/cholesteryl ester hydrolase
MIAGQGYPSETHTVVTEDCYILQMHRIPYGKDTIDDGEPRPPVLLLHGVLGSSADWVMGSPAKSLGKLH